MSLKTLQKGYKRIKALPERAFALSSLRRVLDGTMYDGLKSPFHEEKNGAGEYVPLRDRIPSVRFPVCRILVEDAVSLLFSSDHFPQIHSEDEATREALESLASELSLQEMMIEAATRGSVGSVAIFFKVIEGRVHLSVENTEYLTPEWSKTAPDRLSAVRELRIVKGLDLRADGWDIPEEDLMAPHWFKREWTDVAERWFAPWKVGVDKRPILSEEIQHNLGFVPVVWIRNLPGGVAPDGAPTFTPEMVDTQIEMEYLLSQAGRGLKYAMDPLLMIKEPLADDTGTMVRSASNAIQVSEGGDVKLVEIDGASTAAVIEYVRFLRELVLEAGHGNRASAEKLSAAQSGRAMELMNQALIWLADRLRITYGQNGLLSVVRMIAMASKKIPLVSRDGKKLGELDPSGISLRWPAWYAPTYGDGVALANALKTNTDSGHLSRETALRTLAPVYDIDDIGAELSRIESEEKKRLELLPAPKTTVTLNE